jgi:glucosamine--fructose-6-phosphate aminotransferase (isomerizing)
MCGIAGYSIASGHSIDTSLLTKLFIAGLSERGEDACGYAFRHIEGEIEVVKHSVPPHKFLTEHPIAIPPDARNGIIHVRDFTKGRPAIEGNNHPIMHGRICGVHNGIIQNDDALFELHGRQRALPEMTVDSEAIFMLLDSVPSYAEAFSQLIGSYSVAFFDRDAKESLYLARGRGRPLVVGEGDGFVLFASTRHAISFAADRLGIEVVARSVPHGLLLALRGGEVVHTQKIEVQPFEEEPTATYSRTGETARLARRLADSHVDEAQAQ